MNDPDPHAADEVYYEDSLLGSGESMLPERNDQEYARLVEMRERNLAYENRNEEADRELAEIDEAIRDFVQRSTV